MIHWLRIHRLKRQLGHTPVTRATIGWHLLFTDTPLEQLEAEIKQNEQQQPKTDLQPLQTQPK